MIDETLISRIEAYLEDSLKDDPSRLNHIHNVKKVAISLGSVYHADIPSVIVASYLHDATKNLKDEENRVIAGNIYDKDVPSGCLHAYAAARIAEDTFTIEDQDILNAIRYHCTGRKQMSLLEKLIFVSDFIEDGRDFVSDNLKNLATTDLDQAVFEIMLRKKVYILQTGRPFSSITEEAINYYLMESEELDD